jgi:hypothetical protein
MKKATHNLSHYLPLLGILLAGYFGFSLFSYDHIFQIAMIIATGVGYVAWGIIHHHIHKDLTPAIVAEYIAIGFLGVVIVFSLILRA